jgi:hypothetical protein
VNCPERILRVFSSALCVLVTMALPAAAGAATPSRGPQPHSDRADAIDSPLDLRSVTFGQRGTQLVWKVTTAAAWDVAQLSPVAGRALCVKFFYGNLPNERSRLCVFDAGDEKAGLTYARLDPFGGIVSNAIVPAQITRADKRSFQAVFDPASANLSQGRYSWQVLTEWSCDASQACSDLAPDGGNVIAQIKPLAEPPCFGAASRNPRYRCTNPDLALTVLPPPAEAVLSPNAPCAIVSQKIPYTCQFGVRAAIADRTIALVGDSHAAHWRGAIEVVAQARRWRGYSVTRSGCPLSTSPPDLPKARRDSCMRWRNAVISWFRQHPQVRTVFVSELAGLDVRAPRGRSEREYAVQGYLHAWRRLPKTVRQIIVLRDTPVSRDDTSLCVQRALATRKRPGKACAFSRKVAVQSDPAAVAARRRGHDPRVHLIDLTPYMCSTKLCFPVVGGVLVHKDKTHLTPLFAGTLGPFLLQRVSKMFR